MRPFVLLVTMNTVFYSDIDTFLAGCATTVSFTDFLTGVMTHHPIAGPFLSVSLTLSLQ